ncbi:MAG: response regulator transcription factor [Lachnospiraceae bacterium]|nr:response regulator transcription factor [Lachnospiraceae bacterium]
MRILICDDDVLIRERLQKYINDFFRNNNLKCPELLTLDSGETLLADKETKDIVFLDIEMPGVSGIYTGNELKKQNPNVIIFIVTSYMEYLDEAMRFQVFRYLSKPIDKQRLFRNLKDALQLYHTLVNKIPIETKDGVYSVLSSDIIFVEATERKVIIHTPDSDFESVHNIQYWVNQLSDHCFFQSHRSFIVNMKYVDNFDHTLIHLYNQKFSAYLTRRKYTQFKNAYLLYIESQS